MIVKNSYSELTEIVSYEIRTKKDIIYVYVINKDGYAEVWNYEKFTSNNPKEKTRRTK